MIDIDMHMQGAHENIENNLDNFLMGKKQFQEINMCMQQADREITGLMNKHKDTILKDDQFVHEILSVLREQKQQAEAEAK